MLDSELAHVLVPRWFDSGGMGHLQCRSCLGKQGDRKVDTFLLNSVQPVPPLSELIRKLNFPHHLYQYVMDGIMPSMTYCK